MNWLPTATSPVSVSVPAFKSATALLVSPPVTVNSMTPSSVAQVGWVNTTALMDNSASMVIFSVSPQSLASRITTECAPALSPVKVCGKLAILSKAPASKLMVYGATPKLTASKDTVMAKFPSAAHSSSSTNAISGEVSMSMVTSSTGEIHPFTSLAYTSHNRLVAGFRFNVSSSVKSPATVGAGLPSTRTA